MKIGIIMALGRDDSLADILIDGFRQISDVELRTSEQEGFFEFATTADLILLVYGKKKTDAELAEKIGRWDRTVFIDGSEVGENNRYDFSVQRDVLSGDFKEYGGIRFDMLQKCALYFRREKPYINGIIPLPFGIESSYVRWNENIKKDIDFCCVFGQDEFPLLRRHVREELEKFCKENGFTCWTKKTSTPEEFHQILARSKVGVSVGGGGFDTMRFWEILGNNCILMTETIDIDRKNLNYDRIHEFGNLFDFREQLKKISQSFAIDAAEYESIMADHSSKARALTVINEAKNQFSKDQEYQKLCSVIVSSFDGNEDLWKPFFTLFFRYWPDCPFRVYLITNHKTYPDERVRSLAVGQEKNWAYMTKKALGNISEPYIIWILEDFFFEKFVDTARIYRLISYLKHNTAATIRLFPSPPPNGIIDSVYSVGEQTRDADYRTSLSAGLWDKKVFLDLIKDGENPWQMEIDGTVRSRAFDKKFFSVVEPALPYAERGAIVRGKWLLDAVRLCKREGLNIDFSKRGIDYGIERRARKDRWRKRIKKILGISSH
ncbi:MAG: hypothetical protein AAB420_00490 [Patescibacteria group bacterium]